MQSDTAVERRDDRHGASDPDIAAPALRLEGVSKTYEGSDTPAVSDVSLEVAHGEFVTLLGPSGCGKSTTLRIVAGLEVADAGTVHFSGTPMVDVERGILVPPDKRKIGMVFQAYAIWPHMTVFQNVAFPLKAQKFPRNRIEGLVRKSLELVGMDQFASRPAPLLSGGQQQRVALARAIVTEPSLLLLDEPFSNLDAALRGQMRIETKLLQERLGVTVLFVTHDQTEALALSDRIAVMRGGVIEQQGSPRELYQQPATEFVRDFLGSTLLFTGEVRSFDANDLTQVVLDGPSGYVVEARSYSRDPVHVGQRVQVGVRPEYVEVAAAGSGAGAHSMPGTIQTALFVGDHMEYQVEVDGQGPRVVYDSKAADIEHQGRVDLRIAGSSHGVWPLAEEHRAGRASERAD